GIGDVARNRLIVWGGGHSDYSGNEVYGLTMSDEKIRRLNNPGPVADLSTQVTVLADGTPNARHTYGGLAYIAHADRMFVYGGGGAASAGFFSNDIWTFDLGKLQWQQMIPDGNNSGLASSTGMADYDPVTRNVYLHDTQSFWQYTFETNKLTALDLET